MEKSIAKRFWQLIWDKYVDKQKYTKLGTVKKGMEDTTDSYMVAQAIWNMSGKEFKKLVKSAEVN